MNKLLLTVTLSITAAYSAHTTMDSARGARLFETLGCVQCHSINGQGGKVGPDLGRNIDRNFTPASLAATMWNHAPAMWAAMKERDITAGALDEQAAADLFAYFYSAHFFDKPGDAGRGKQAFASKHCASCHELTKTRLPSSDPIALVNDMWNHASTMKAEFAKRGFRWPELTSQELTDILVYLRHLPSLQGTPRETSTIRIDSSGGATLFVSKGCAECHTGSRILDLSERLKHMTLTEVAAEMWNHEPRMAKTPAHLDLDEMQRLLGYLWAGQFFESAGNASRGAAVFDAKRCTLCHLTGVSGAPKFPAPDRTFSGASMVSALWHHGPRMLAEMNNTGVRWPRFDGTQMADVIAYLNSQTPRKK